MSEEQQLKEKPRYQRPSMTEEQKMHKREYDRMRRANMTDEQRLKRNSSYRKANLSEERLMKKREIERRRRANMTEEQRLRKKELDRKRSANMTEEQRLKKYQSTINSQKRKSDMTEEEIQRKKEYMHQKYVNMTEEQRIKRKEYQLKWRANMSEEKLKKVKEYERTRWARLAEERKMKKNENVSDMTDEQLNKWSEFLNQMEKTNTIEKNDVQYRQKITKERIDPLKNLIYKMIKFDMNLEKIIALRRDLLCGILKLIGIENPSDVVIMHNYKSAIDHLGYEIDICYLVELLRRWRGWRISVNVNYLSSDECYMTLFNHLKTNFTEFKLHSDEFLLYGLNDLFNTENFISVSCSLKQLSALFYHNPENHIKLNRIYDLPYRMMTNLPNSVIIWPYVSTRIAIHNFTMTHQNNHLNEYKLINMGNTFNTIPVARKFTNLFVKGTTKKSKTYVKNNVVEFLRQLKISINEKVSDNVSIEKKIEVLSVLTMFENDINLCPNVIESNVTYNRSLCPHSYARYLGCPDDGNIRISTSEQKEMKNYVTNVRLRQILHPNVSFFINNFNMFTDTKNNDLIRVFNKWFKYGINKCISYDCLLCDEVFGSSYRRIADHFIEHHGLEPDWECINCLQSFDNNRLLINDWKHDCRYNIPE